MEQSDNKRLVNLDLLRIVSMLMIVTLHFLGHGGVLNSLPVKSLGYYVAWFVEGISFVAVNCYVLISGYFLIDSKFTVKKLLILMGEVFFYSVLIYFILLFSGFITFSWKGLLCFFPVLSQQYWFVTMYLGMYVLSPFMNRVINALNQKQHLTWIIIFTLLFSIWPNIFFFTDTLSFGNGTGVVWFMVLYFVASYIKLYYKPTYNIKPYILIYLLLAVSVPISRYIFTLIYNINGIDLFLRGAGIFYSYNSMLVYPASVALLLLFLNIRINSNLLHIVIQFFAPLTFGIYLIHDNINLRPILWNFINAPSHLNNSYFITWSFFVILGIFCICSLIDKLRFLLFGKIIRSKWLNNISFNISYAFSVLIQKIMRSKT